MNKNAVTREEVLENMVDVIVRTLQDFGKPTTYVTVRMKNGFTLRESTTCVDPENYDEEIGKEICLRRIEDKIWYLLGYALQERLHSERQSVMGTGNPNVNSAISHFGDGSRRAVNPQHEY